MTPIYGSMRPLDIKKGSAGVRILSLFGLHRRHDDCGLTRSAMSRLAGRIAVLIPLLASSALLSAVPARAQIEPSEFAARRQRAMAKVPDGLIAIHSFSGFKHWDDAGFHQDPAYVSNLVARERLNHSFRVERCDLRHAGCLPRNGSRRRPRAAGPPGKAAAWSRFRPDRPSLTRLARLFGPGARSALGIDAAALGRAAFRRAARSARGACVSG
jgi:hypothetical protein